MESKGGGLELLGKREERGCQVVLGGFVCLEDSGWRRGGRIGR